MNASLFRRMMLDRDITPLRRLAFIKYLAAAQLLFLELLSVVRFGL